MPFKQAVHPVKSGIALIQNELRITDTDQPHPFKPDQLMGHPQLYLIVDDAQGQMFPNPDATNLEQPYFMTPAYNEFGLQGLRENMISYRWLDNGDPMHDDSGLLDAVRYIGWRFFPAAAHITQQERQDKDLPFNLRMDNITQQTDVNEINRLMHNRQIQLQVQEYINQAITKSNNRPNKTPVYYRNPSSFRSIKGA
jgi:hypothetical protein